MGLCFSSKEESIKPVSRRMTARQLALSAWQSSTGNVGVVGVPLGGAKDIGNRAYDMWESLDANKNNSASLKEIMTEFKKMNLLVNKKFLQQLFDKHDVSKKKELSKAEFANFFYDIDARADMTALYESEGKGFEVTAHVKSVRRVGKDKKNSMDATSGARNLWTVQTLYEFFQKHYPADPMTEWTPPNLGQCAELIRKYMTLSNEGKKKYHFMNVLTGKKDGKKLYDESRSHSVTPNGYLDERGFILMLSDLDHNSVCDAKKVHSVYQDMTRPLSHYFISASHNSYLEGAQFNGTSSADAIQRALEMGVRVIEVDVWPGRGEPMVTHGYANCTKVPFERCVQAIDRFAFVASKYPVILTIENHCVTKEQQLQIAQILQRVLKTKLHKPTINPGGDLFTGPLEWLSPHELMGKVIIRDKPRKNRHHHEEDEEAAPKSKRKSVKEILIGTKLKKNVSNRSNKSKEGSNKKLNSESLTSVSGRSLNAEEQIATIGEESGRSLATEVVDETKYLERVEREDLYDYIDNSIEDEGLTQVVSKVEEEARKVLSKGVGSIRNFINEMGIQDDKLPQWMKESYEKDTTSDKSLLELIYIKNLKLKFNMKDASGEEYDKAITMDEPPWASSSSIPELKMKTFCKPGAYASAMASYTNRHLVRCFPKGSRVDSSNYDPTPAWCLGMQIVALNYQTRGPMVWLNQGMFADNGACGYVLKPRRMLEAKESGVRYNRSNPVRKEGAYWDLKPSAFPPSPDILTITLVSAHYLPKPVKKDAETSEIIDPFVNVYLFTGMEFDKPNADPLVYKTKTINDNGFDPVWNETVEIKMTCPEMAHLLFEVRDADYLGTEFIAQCCVPVKLMRPGFRVIPLRDADGIALVNGGFLFVKVAWARGARE